jgi:acetyltransferase-like isoleucine patch superfamily enzyme
MVSEDVIKGKEVIIIEPVNIYGCKLADNVRIGPFVEIQKDVIIGRDSKIQSHSFICEMVSIGESCFIGHGVMFVNDDFRSNHGPAKGNKSLWKKTIIEDNVSIGSNATILPVRVCAGSVIGAGSVVTKDIDVKGIYAGNPAKLIRII